MSQVSHPSSTGEEERPVSDEVKKASSPPKPPRYPSFRFRRAVSKTPSRMKEEEEAHPHATRTQSGSPTTVSESDVPDGSKLFHVRVTLGYLKAIQKTEKQKPLHSAAAGAAAGAAVPAADTLSLVTAFASLDAQVSNDHNFAPSLPLTPGEITNVVWPKQNNNTVDGTDKSNRRLYFSIAFQREEEDAELRNVLAREDDLSTVTGTSAWNHQDEETDGTYAPELIHIQLGVARGKDLLHLGVATLVVDGADVSGKRMNLPVRTLLPGEDDSFTTSPKKSRGLKRLFGKKCKSDNSFAMDEYEYSFTPNAILRIRLDVLSDPAPFARSSMSGPAVWGDGVEDDNDSFASIVALDMSTTEVETEESQHGQLSSGIVHMSTNESESIEVVDNPAGPSIISAPPTYVDPHVADLDTAPVSSTRPVTSVAVAPSVTVTPQDRFSPRCVNNEPSPSFLSSTGIMCGFTDAFRHQAIEADLSQSLDFEDSSTIATSLYKGTKGEAWKISPRKKSAAASTASSGILQDRSLATVEERTAEHSSRYSASRSSVLRSTASRDHCFADDISIGEDTVESLNYAKRALKYYAKRTGITYDEMLELLDIASSASDLRSLAEPSIGEDTINSVFEAKDLLQSYADRVGVDVEELLATDVVNWDTTGDSTEAFLPSCTHGIRSADETEGTNTTKSSRSRFSIFVDD